MSQGVHLRKYGVEFTIDFELYEVDGVSLRTDWTPAAADCEVQKDGGDYVQCTNTAAAEDGTYSITITATEAEAARIVIKVVDAATKVFLDKVIVIETYGNASAQHAFDLDTSTVDLSATGLDSVVMSDPAARPAITASIVSGISWIANMVLSKNITNKTNQEIEFYNDAGAKVAEADISDDGTLFTRDKVGTSD